MMLRFRRWLHAAEPPAPTRVQDRCDDRPSPAEERFDVARREADATMARATRMHREVCRRRQPSWESLFRQEDR